MQKEISRKFNWISSSNPANKELLQQLNQQMTDFYSKSQSRDTYQEMIDNIDNGITSSFLNYAVKTGMKSFLEVGCGSGKLYKLLRKQIKNVQYTGIELSEKVIRQNKVNYPEAEWHVAGAYDIPTYDESVDVCFSFYVLEHLVYPEEAIVEMLRVVKKGGILILIFPDFVASKRFASQRLGFSDLRNSKAKVKKGKLVDALISLYDGKIRLHRALETAVTKFGPFPVNLSPKCLSAEPISMYPDIDAVYIASKKEIEKWAESKNYKYLLPEGDQGFFSGHAFVSIEK
jgi:ubiquinone/menaquinone biosynthesis C-methylase UbiE